MRQVAQCSLNGSPLSLSCRGPVRQACDQELGRRSSLAVVNHRCEPANVIVHFQLCFGSCRTHSRDQACCSCKNKDGPGPLACTSVAKIVDVKLAPLQCCQGPQPACCCLLCETLLPWWGRAIVQRWSWHFARRCTCHRWYCWAA